MIVNRPEQAPRQASELASPARRVLADFFGRSAQRRELVVPEGVPLTVTLPDIGERAVAFCADIGICLIAACLVSLAVSSVLPVSANASMMVLAFVVRNFYFVFFELRWRGRTPGKRFFRILVIDRSVNSLSPQAVIVRNLMREVELFTPVQMLLMTTWQRTGWEALPILAWLGFFLLVPALNSDRMRAGDFAAGTLVISLPSILLLPEVSTGVVRFRFRESELTAYGEDELHVLDHVLRQFDTSESAELRQAVYDRIRRKIGRAEVTQDVDTFLKDFYVAQRMHLERRRLFGRERKSKLDQ